MIAALKFCFENSTVFLPGLLALLAFNRGTHAPSILNWRDGVPAMIVAEIIHKAINALSWIWIAQWEDPAKFAGALLVAWLIGGCFIGMSRVSDHLRLESRRSGVPAKSRVLQWHQIFRAEQSHVVLHMKDGRQILGWPEGWPEDPVNGHFLLTKPRMIFKGRTRQIEPSAAAVLLPASDVAWIHFLDQENVEAAAPFDELRDSGMKY
jgi:hypothetical protein